MSFINRLSRNAQIALGITVLAVLWVLSGFFGGGDSAPPKVPVADKSVQVLSLTPESHQQVMRLVGYTASSRAVTLVAETSGTVEEILVQNGQAVTRTVLLMKLDLQTKPAQLRAAQAAVKAAELEVQAARRLNREGFQAATTLAQREAELAVAQERLALIQKSVDDTAITAPFKGVVDEILVDEGQFVDEGEPLVRFIDDQNLLLVAPIGQGERADLAVGQTVSATLADGSVAAGVVQSLTRQAQDRTRTFTMEAAVNGDIYPMPLNMSADVVLRTADVPAIKVPHAALVLNNEGLVGLRAASSAAGTATVVFHPVTLLDDTPVGQWVTGLEDTVHVITRGQAAVIAGQTVQAVAAE